MTTGKKLTALANALDAAKGDRHETLRLVFEAWVLLKRIADTTRPAKNP